MDIELYQTAFGGLVFEPMTDAGHQWLQDVVERNPDYPIYQHLDGCMAGFSNDALGVESCDFEAFAADMIDAGIKSNIEAKGN